MRNDELMRKLKDSVLTPGSYSPSLGVTRMLNTVITANGIMVLGTGLSCDDDTQRESKELIENENFKLIVSKHIGYDVELKIEQIRGEDINWKNEEVGVVRSEAGVQEQGNDEGDLHWIVFGDNALALATALSICHDVQKIARAYS